MAYESNFAFQLAKAIKSFVTTSLNPVSNLIRSGAVNKSNTHFFEDPYTKLQTNRPYSIGMSLKPLIERPDTTGSLFELGKATVQLESLQSQGEASAGSSTHMFLDWGRSRIGVPINSNDSSFWMANEATIALFESLLSETMAQLDKGFLEFMVKPNKVRGSNTTPADDDGTEVDFDTDVTNSYDWAVQLYSDDYDNIAGKKVAAMRALRAIELLVKGASSSNSNAVVHHVVPDFAYTALSSIFAEEINSRYRNDIQSSIVNATGDGFFNIGNSVVVNGSDYLETVQTTKSQGISFISHAFQHGMLETEIPTIFRSMETRVSMDQLMSMSASIGIPGFTTDQMLRLKGSDGGNADQEYISLIMNNALNSLELLPDSNRLMFLQNVMFITANSIGTASGRRSQGTEVTSDVIMGSVRASPKNIAKVVYDPVDFGATPVPPFAASTTKKRSSE